jgi:transketolase N-terminal domain/subunit
MKVTKDDFDKAKEKVLYLKKGDIPEGLYIWLADNHYLKKQL